MTSTRQQIRFVQSSDGVRLAYARTGRGPTVVKAATWLSHLEHDWTSPERLVRLLTDTGSRVQFIFAGKAHPNDNEGKKIIQELQQLCRRHGHAPILAVQMGQIPRGL